MVEPDNIILRVHVACCVTKAIHTLGIYNTVLIAFPRQQLLRKRASVLHYTYIACRLVFPFHRLGRDLGRM
jgi:hypothetical protein